MSKKFPMSLPSRARATSRATSRARASTVIAPTRGEVQVAAKAIARLLKQDEEMAKALFAFAIQSTSTARAAVEYGSFLVRCAIGDDKVANPPRNKEEWMQMEAPIRGFVAKLRTERVRDKRLGSERLLTSTPLGRKLTLSRGERQYLVEVLSQVFLPPEGTPLADQLYQTVVGHGGWNLLFGDWLVRRFLDEEGTIQYEEAMKAARAETS